MARHHCPAAGQRAENNWCLALLLTGRARELFTRQRGTLDGPVVKKSPAYAGDMDSILPKTGDMGLLRFHVLWSN